MPRALTWPDLKIGLFSAAAVAALVVGVLTFARIGALHGEKTTLYMVSDEASHVLRGTEVWLAGQRVGTVTDVRFRPVTTDTAERLLIRMEILSQYVRQIRHDSNVQLRPGTSLIAEPVVAITAGTVVSPPVRAGDTLRARPQLVQGPAMADAASLGDSVGAVMSNVRALTAEVRATTTRPMLQLRRRTELQAAAVERAITQFTTRPARRANSAALLLHDTTLRTSVALVGAQTDSIRLLLSSTRTSLGRFRRDSTLLVEVHGVLANADRLRALLARLSEPRTWPDSATKHRLVRQLDLVHLQLDSLITDARRHPLKYIAF